MLDPRAVKAFKNRTLRNSDRVKEFSPDALQRKLVKLDSLARFELPPYAHQVACFLLCLKYPYYFLCLDMGLGKTMIMLSLFRYLWENEQADRMLVLVPFATNLPTWAAELDKWAPELGYTLLDSKKDADQKHAAFWGKREIVVTTYAGLRSILCQRKNGKDVPHLTSIKAVGDYFDMVVCDESTAFKNSQKLTFRLMRAVRKHVDRLYNLSGTPFSSDPQNLWSQFYVVDQGETLGQTLGLFREVFFSKTQMNWGRRDRESRWSFQYSLKKSEEKNLHRVLRHSSIRYEESECQDLPAVVGGIANPMIHFVSQSREQMRYTGMLEDQIRNARVSGESVDAIYYKWRCVSSGYFPIGESFKDFDENPKLEELLSIIEEAAGNKLIIYLHFHHTIDLVRDILKRGKISYAEAHGRVRDKGAQLKKFMTKSQVLLASGAAAYGLNLQFCHRTVYFETPDDIASRRQSEKRTHRDGQQSDTVYFYDLVVHGTADPKILTSLQDGKRVLDVVIDGV